MISFILFLNSMSAFRSILLYAVIFLIAFIVYPFYLVANSGDRFSNIVSPLPDFLTKNFYKVLGSGTYWKPSVDTVIDVGISKPNLTAKGAIAYDLGSDKLLYEKNMKERMPVASLTKIMTAIVALENIDIEKEINISKSAASVGENSMGLAEGEILTLEDLLYGLILSSGNDASEAIAQASPFGRENFVYFMNKKAEELGLSDTHFTNPSGLEGEGSQYSTAYDLLVMAKYALENRTFAQIASTVIHEIPYTQNHKFFYLFNETNLLTSYPGVRGVKTGYTYEAGLCLVTYLEHEGHRIIAILLNSESRREEMKELLDYSLRTLGVKPPPHN